MILPRHRKTEPILLWWTKVVVSMILSSGLIAYIVALTILIKNEEPSIQYSTNKLDSQRYPAFNITLFDSNVIIDCKFVTIEGSRNCSASLELVGQKYKFTPTENMINGGSSHVTISWNSIPGYNYSDLAFGVELDDIKNKYPDQINLREYIEYLQSNVKIVQENTTNRIVIKWTRREYLIRNWTNYLGFPNHRIPLYIAEPLVLTPRSLDNLTMILILPYGSRSKFGYFETVETEKRNQTVLSNIGPLGGAIGLLLGIYAILFGRSLLNPWGFFQKCCYKYKSRSKKKLLNNLPMIPLTSKTQLHYEKSKDSDISRLEDHFISLNARFNSLETILKEYVINSDFLDELAAEKIEIESDTYAMHSIYY